ncbi:hypothetical protein [Rhizobium arsenicireducens]
MRRFSTSLDDDLYALLESRAELNRRSMNKELVFLLETALASEHGENLDILRTLMMASGGVSALNPAPS